MQFLNHPILRKGPLPTLSAATGLQAGGFPD